VWRPGGGSSTIIDILELQPLRIAPQARWLGQQKKIELVARIAEAEAALLDEPMAGMSLRKGGYGKYTP